MVLPLPGTGPFRGSSAAVTRQQLRARRFRRLHRDVYLLQPADVCFEVACDAALLAIPDATLSHQTAARLWRLPVDDDGLVHVTRPARASVSRLPHVRTHRSPLTADELDALAGRPVTSLARTWLDLAADLDVDEAVVLGDAVVRRTGPAALEQVVDRAGRRKGVVVARAALPLLDGRSASPGESRCRLLLHRAGFDALTHAVPVHDRAGHWVCEADLGDAVARVAVQYDGLVHFGREVRQRLTDLARDELARAAGWQVVVLTGRDLHRPDLAVGKVAAAYDRARALRRATAVSRRARPHDAAHTGAQRDD